MFVDQVKIFAKAGDGGNGCVSFRREKFVEQGGPDGGDGGRGGDITLVASPNLHDLTNFHYAPRVVAKNGDHGRGKNCYGRRGADIELAVPVGTEVWQLTKPVRILKRSRYHPAAATEEFQANALVGRPYTDARRRPGPPPEPDAYVLSHEENTPDRQLIADLVEPGQRFVLARGGRGGRGNTAFKSSTYRAPRDFEFGEPGEQLEVELILKTIADIGLIGYPNAGKSTLLSKLTKAQPKIASYPFTTLAPNIGILSFDDFQRVRVADIPGLIEGAHAGKGLGHEFLRHIERCRLLLVLLDMAGADNRDPRDDYKQLLAELKLHDDRLLTKPRMVVANKMDEPASKKNLTAFQRRHKVKLLPVSALTGDGLDELKLAIRKSLRKE